MGTPQHAGTLRCLQPGPLHKPRGPKSHPEPPITSRALSARTVPFSFSVALLCNTASARLRGVEGMNQRLSPWPWGRTTPSRGAASRRGWGSRGQNRGSTRTASPRCYNPRCLCIGREGEKLIWGWSLPASHDCHPPAYREPCHEVSRLRGCGQEGWVLRAMARRGAVPVAAPGATPEPPGDAGGAGGRHRWQQLGMVVTLGPQWPWEGELKPKGRAGSKHPPASVAAFIWGGKA